MTQKYSFFDAVEGLPKYTAQDVADRTAALAGKQNGYLVGNQEGLTVAVAGTNVTLQTGAALIQGRLYVNDEDITFSVPLCSTGKIRRDRVVIKLDTAVESRNIVAYIKQGVEGVSGISPPSLTQAGTIYELSVARLEVTDTAIIVVDERDTDTCPELYTGEAAAQVSLGHSARTNNPHGVTKAQVGLGNADNTADADKPLSTAVTNALANYLLKSNIINDLVTGGTDKALSAEMGKQIANSGYVTATFGTFTPRLENTGYAPPTYTAQHAIGYYYKIGRLVNIQVVFYNVNITFVGSNTYPCVGGIPFPISNIAPQAEGDLYGVYNMFSSEQPVVLKLDDFNPTKIIIMNAQGVSVMQYKICSGAELRFGMTYVTD
ncbi:MAG: hypothetical protein ACOXZ0_08220 [Eubacteriales bacterium]|jgi:hypothetical protein